MHPSPRGGAISTRTGRRPLRTIAAVAFAVGLGLLALAIVLTRTLPASTRAEHWSIAWAGLDAADAAGCLATAVLVLRGSRRAALTAVATASLLAVDAWFDVCTAAAGHDRWVATLEAGCAELPIALVATALAVWLTRPPPASGHGADSGPPAPQVDR